MSENRTLIEDQHDSSGVAHYPFSAFGVIGVELLYTIGRLLGSTGTHVDVDSGNCSTFKIWLTLPGGEDSARERVADLFANMAEGWEARIEITSAPSEQAGHSEVVMEFEVNGEVSTYDLA